MEVSQAVKLQQDGITRYYTFDMQRQSLVTGFGEDISGIVSHIPSYLSPNNPEFIDIITRSGAEIVIRTEWIQ